MVADNTRELVPAARPVSMEVWNGRNSDRGAVVPVELPKSSARNARVWDWRPIGRHKVREVVARLGDPDRAREVAAGFNRQALRSKYRRIWAALLEGEDAEQCGVGSMLLHGELVK